jgi:hypothetical protein
MVAVLDLNIVVLLPCGLVDTADDAAQGGDPGGVEPLFWRSRAATLVAANRRRDCRESTASLI